MLDKGDRSISLLSPGHNLMTLEYKKASPDKRGPVCSHFVADVF